MRPATATLQEGSYDFVVVGAGSAGCAIAARLSESGRHRVLLLEAGPRDTLFWIHAPLGYSMLFANPKVNWMFESEAEPGLGGRRMYQPRGKVLGGSSSINGMLYVRGHQFDFDDWRRVGCIGWGWEDVLPYFRKAEDQQRGADPFHGIGGPLKVSDHAYRHELAEAVLAAAREAGLPANPDFNGADLEGAGYYQVNIFNGRRWSAARGYLESVRHRPNLRIVTDAHAERLLLDEGRAAGVEYRTSQGLHSARALGEVVLATGVFGSPQLLMLSGIGDAKHLADFGIQPLVDLPDVGRNLQDHFFVQMMFRCTRPITINDFARSWPRKLLSGARYLLLRRGELASNGIYAGGFVRSDDRLDRPDIQFNVISWSVASRTIAGAKPHPFSGFTMSTTLLRPDARGSVRLRSTDSRSPPEIRFNFMQTQYDVRAIVFGMRLVRHLSQQPSLAAYVAEEVQPGLAVQSDAEFEAAARDKGVSALHGVGTCRMGEDPGSVVDPQLRVRQVRGLRVADASIMPRIVAGNTHAASVMIGEKAADMILQDAKVA